MKRKSKDNDRQLPLRSGKGVRRLSDAFCFSFCFYSVWLFKPWALSMDIHSNAIFKKKKKERESFHPPQSQSIYISLVDAQHSWHFRFFQPFQVSLKAILTCLTEQYISKLKTKWQIYEQKKPHLTCRII